MAYRLMTCRRCGSQQERGSYGRGSYFCDPCGREHTTEGLRASAAVQRARAKGDLPNAPDCTCADCGNTASQYDHRDYTKPLEVDPVCRSCNVKRGPAFDSVYRPV